ncbi:TlpA family protein disulfide reductase [Pseudanabaena mucicola]|uniref:Redoxin domain-containing protein n=1 Tax=Pseudanabaena mucicola FACHB-723 TaxID=2692860 RepID=A0ABR7ZWV2_9CYAN|nr:thioredoxin domain-containing protein [Pseudanabaena mucicola]MBD2188438.1 redoxin domain-containing protein [Pseudanabaena mucicola FACHB-723]
MKAKYLNTLTAIALLSLGTAIVSVKPESIQKSVSEAITGEAAHAQSASVGGSLAKKLQGKPVVVDIYASWCSACKNIAPTLSQLKQQYAGKVHFVVLDVSDRSTTAQSETIAKELGLSAFFAANKTQTGSLTIVDPSTGKILSQQRNNPNKDTYTKVLDAALAKK